MCEMKGPCTQRRHNDRTFKNTEWGQITDSPCEAKMKIKKKKINEINSYPFIFCFLSTLFYFMPSFTPVTQYIFWSFKNKCHLLSLLCLWAWGRPPPKRQRPLKTPPAQNCHKQRGGVEESCPWCWRDVAQGWHQSGGWGQWLRDGLRLITSFCREYRPSGKSLKHFNMLVSGNFALWRQKLIRAALQWSRHTYASFKC